MSMSNDAIAIANICMDAIRVINQIALELENRDTAYATAIAQAGNTIAERLNEVIVNATTP